MCPAIDFELILIARLDRLGASELHTGGVMPSGKIKSLLHFLDHVDTASSPSEVDSLV